MMKRIGWWIGVTMNLQKALGRASVQPYGNCMLIQVFFLGASTTLSPHLRIIILSCPCASSQRIDLCETLGVEAPAVQAALKDDGGLLGGHLHVAHRGT